MSAALAPADVEHSFYFLNLDSLSLAVGAERHKRRLPAMRAMKLFHFLLPLEAATRPSQSLGLLVTNTSAGKQPTAVSHDQSMPYAQRSGARAGDG
jgi:hypothetical protein